jgi:superfamily II DNA or RNA helicase
MASGMAAVADFQSRVLRQKRTPNEYQVYRAALEWDLTDPIIIESSADFKSTPRWRERLEPYHHQVTNLITFCRRLPVTLLADDVGLGKTISAGLILSELIARNRLAKVLIVAPKLLGPQWKEELLSKFDIPAEIAIGKDLKTAEPADTGAVITTYNSARLYLDAIPEDRFQMLILDEAHKLRNLYGVDKAPQVAKRFRDALEARRFRFVLMLTATPIQNRLWDLYSLVDLLTVARGHQNPFGNQGQFARRFIADGRDNARQLKAEAREQFRSIVYGYMSRVRRGDAKLYFPDRVVQMHRVNPTPAELELIGAIAKPIQLLNRLAQISILQALTSSPDALNAQLANMARRGTIPVALSQTVKAIVERMPPSAKLRGLGSLIERLKKENAKSWRLVVFTGRRETQTTIQSFLEEQGLTVGLINGDSGERNQVTIAKFRQNPPAYRVIVSTEAGSEGVNLQVANVLVNYDLPWNPMIVEQRIGRIQRLASQHAHVSIFNVMLRGTFEEYIVGRLMEKLQMASHAIGDIESLLQASDVGDEDGDGATGFEEKLLALVLAALAGKDVEAETRLAEKSIADAKETLEREESGINDLLGSMDGAEYVGPRAPTLPPAVRSMEAKDFAIAALQELGSTVVPKPPDLYEVRKGGHVEFIRFDEHAPILFKSTLYDPNAPAFQRLVDEVVATGIHELQDIDQEPAQASSAIAKGWLEKLGATPGNIEMGRVLRSFSGDALLRVRATVAHDGYERLVNVPCRYEDHRVVLGSAALSPLSLATDKPADLGLDTQRLREAAEADEAIAEFTRFYLERRTQETQAANDDERKRKKLEDDFTPRLTVSLVGASGRLRREVELVARYSFENSPSYESRLRIVPSSGEVVDKPELRTCSKLGRPVPASCLSRCDVSNVEVLSHFLLKSEISGRRALPEHTVFCGYSGKRVLKDEADVSSVTGKLVAKAFLKRSSLSGDLAEAEHFGRCGFTNAEVLKSELVVSELSGKPYRAFEQMRSAASGKTGHKSEFITCYETREPLGRVEAETCQSTGNLVRPGVLQNCAVTHKRVLPSELDRCAFTHKRALKNLFVKSSISHMTVLEEAAIRSAAGKHCMPSEAQICSWSERRFHPDDLQTCSLVGLTVHSSFLTDTGQPRLKPLVEMLDGNRKNADSTQVWPSAATRLAEVRKVGKCRVEAATKSPSDNLLAMSCETKALLGLRIHQLGAVFDIRRNDFVGRVVDGKRRPTGWTQSQ